MLGAKIFLLFIPLLFMVEAQNGRYIGILPTRKPMLRPGSWSDRTSTPDLIPLKPSQNIGIVTELPVQEILKPEPTSINQGRSFLYPDNSHVISDVVPVDNEPKQPESSLWPIPTTWPRPIPSVRPQYTLTVAPEVKDPTARPIAVYRTPKNTPVVSAATESATKQGWWSWQTPAPVQNTPKPAQIKYTDTPVEEIPKPEAEKLTIIYPVNNDQKQPDASLWPRPTGWTRPIPPANPTHLTPSRFPSHIINQPESTTKKSIYEIPIAKIVSEVTESTQVPVYYPAETTSVPIETSAPITHPTQGPVYYPPVTTATLPAVIESTTKATSTPNKNEDDAPEHEYIGPLYILKSQYPNLWPPHIMPKEPWYPEPTNPPTRPPATTVRPVASTVNWQPVVTNKPETTTHLSTTSDHSISTLYPKFNWQPVVTSTTRKPEIITPRNIPPVTSVTLGKGLNWLPVVTSQPWYPQPTVPSTKSPITSISTSSPWNQLYDYICAEPDAYYSVSRQCDVYIECKDNIAIQYSCPDGLHYNPEIKWPEFPCSYPSEVQCSIEDVVQEPLPTSECPRRYGFFPVDSEDCGKYIMCQDGNAEVMNCPSGLAFNFATSSCDWPVNVPGCNPDAFQGFTCPAPPLGEEGEASHFIKKYRYGKSCRKYIACQDGHPRLLSCDNRLSFDENSESCVDSEFVLDCNE